MVLFAKIFHSNEKLKKKSKHYLHSPRFELSQLILLFGSYDKNLEKLTKVGIAYKVVLDTFYGY